MSVSRYANLAKLSGEPQIKALAQAVNFDLALTNLYIDVMGSAAGKASKGVHVLAANESRVESGPRLDAIKAVLAQKWAVPGDNPVLADTATRVQTFFHTNMPEIDLGWTNLFLLNDMRTANQDSFDIIDTNAGVAFEQQKPGAKIKIRREFSESLTTVKLVTESAGIGILDDWLRYQKWWNVEQVVDEFRANAWDKQAQLHYGLLTGLGAGINQAFATDDTVTFNAAVASIFRNLRSKGRGLGQNAGIWIVCAPEHVGRILKMLEVRSGSQILAMQGNKEPIAYTVAGVITSTHIPANSSGYYVVLPGRKNQRAVWKDLSIEQQRDIYSRGTDWVGHMQFNAAIGDTAQVRRVLFA